MDYYDLLATMIDKDLMKHGGSFWRQCPHQFLAHVEYQGYILCDIMPNNEQERTSWMVFKDDHRKPLSIGTHENLEGVLQELDEIRSRNGSLS